MTLAATALTTIAAVQAELGIEDGTTRIERLINVAVDRITRYCGRTFHYEAARVDVLPGYGGPILYLPKGPVLEVASVSYDGSTLNTDDYAIHTRSDSAFAALYRSSGWTWTAPTVQGPEASPFPGGERNLWTITHECGFVTPGQVTAGPPALVRSLPYDLEQAAVLLAASWYPLARDLRVTSERLLSWSATYSMTSDIPEPIKELLAAYMSVEVA